VLSTVRKNGVGICGPNELKRALKNSAVSGGVVDPFSQGSGLVSALSCAEYIINNHGKRGQDMAINVSIPSRNNARGIYIRDEVELDGPMTFNVLVKPQFSHANQRTTEEMDELLSLQIHLTLKSSESWVTCPDSMTLLSAEERDGQTFAVRLNTQGLKPGVHYASVDAIDASDEARGPLFTLPITIIIPHSKVISVQNPKFLLNESSEAESIELKENGLDMMTTFELRQGVPNRRFFTVPSQAEWVTITLRSSQPSTDGNSPRIYMHAVPFVRGDMPNTECQLKRVVTINDGTEKEFHLRTKGGSTLELCLQTLWLANPSPALVTADIEFHSFNTKSPTLISSPVTITGAAEFARLGVSAPLRAEQLNPVGSLKSVSRALRPNKFDITLGSLQRDAEPPSDAALTSDCESKPTQIYEMRCSYPFKVDSDKPIDVRPSFPSLFNQLYDSPFDSQLWSLVDSNSKIISYGSSMHHASASSLKKGDYTITLLLRHPNSSVLEQLKDVPCEVSFTLKDPMSCKLYGQLDKASTPSVKDDGRSPLDKQLLCKGSYQDIYVARPTDEMPKWTENGDVLVGTLVLDKEKETATSMKLLYVIPPKSKAKNGDSDEDKSKKADTLEDVVFKAKLGHLATLRTKNVTTYQDIATKLKEERPSDVPLMSELLSFALESPLPDNLTSEDKYRSEEIEKVYNMSLKSSDGPIDPTLLAQYFGLNEPDKDELDADDEAKELKQNMTEQHDFLKKMLLSRASIRGSLAANNTDPSDLSLFDKAVKDMKQWVKLENLKDDDEKINFTVTLSRHARLFQERQALALSLILKAKKDLTAGKNLRQLDDELLAILGSLEASHLQGNIQDSLHCRYPVIKRNV
jgi:tripeptidyl-peptidase-2